MITNSLHLIERGFFSAGSQLTSGDIRLGSSCTCTDKHIPLTVGGPRGHRVLYLDIISYSILSYSILFYPILSYSILFYPILSYPMLCYAILFYSILFYSIPLYYIISTQRPTARRPGHAPRLGGVLAVLEGKRGSVTTSVNFRRCRICHGMP